MIEVSSGRASDAEGHFSAGGRFVRLLSDRRIRVAAAILLLAGGFNITAVPTHKTPQAALKVQGGRKAMSSRWQFRGIVRL